MSEVRTKKLGREEEIRRKRASFVLFSIPAVLAFYPTSEGPLGTIILE